MKKTLCTAAFFAGTLIAGAHGASAQEAPPPADPPQAPPYTVVAGDSLSKISEARLQTSTRWVEIYVLNRDAVSNPNQIEVGQVLKIPATPVPVPADVLASLAPAAAPAASHRSSAGSASSASHAATATGHAPTATGSGGGLAAIRACESGGNYGAVSASGQYRGAYQFDQRTWQSVGGTGDPAAASPAEQDARAAQLASQRGTSPWTNCG